VSVFKLMTGEDVVLANRKYGAQFTFTNRALFAFSANELPTIGEGSRAYSERIKPFRFDRSFAGREDPRSSGQ
jgi:putative DNA primase/helicase